MITTNRILDIVLYSLCLLLTSELMISNNQKSSNVQRKSDRFITSGITWVCESSLAKVDPEIWWFQVAKQNVNGPEVFRYAVALIQSCEVCVKE
jgi:hypothetical protein